MSDLTRKHIDLVVGGKFADHPDPLVGAVLAVAAGIDGAPPDAAGSSFARELQSRLDLVRERVHEEQQHLRQVEAVASEYFVPPPTTQATTLAERAPYLRLVR